MGPEAKVQKVVVDYARQKGCVAIKLSTVGMMGSSGWPDYLFLGPRRKTWFLEFKAPGKSCTDLQLARHAELQKLGHCVYVCSDRVAGKGIIDVEMGRKVRRFIVNPLGNLV
jgi:hypothetical protein